MSRRRQQRRADKTRRHLPSTHEPRDPVRQSARIAPPRVVVLETSYVERLAYTRSQAALALGISRSTLRRLLPYVETIEMPWGGKLIPVDEIERLARERRRAAVAARRPKCRPGRKRCLCAEVVEKIRTERSGGKSLRQIADALNGADVPTAHGGTRWWASTVRAVLERQPRT
jgi:hypothetical protein